MDLKDFKMVLDDVGNGYLSENNITLLAEEVEKKRFSIEKGFQ